MIDDMLYCIILIQDRCSEQPPRSKQHEVFDEMLRRKTFLSSAGLTFTDLVNLAMSKGLVYYDDHTEDLTACAVSGRVGGTQEGPFSKVIEHGKI